MKLTVALFFEIKAFKKHFSSSFLTTQLHTQALACVLVSQQSPHTHWKGLLYLPKVLSDLLKERGRDPR